MTANAPATPMALEGIKIVDCSRVVAGPIIGQTLGDLGADVIKVERPGVGDDLRNWGPPFLKDADGNDTTESAYFLTSNRNKRSLTLDISKENGKDILLSLLEDADIFVENYKTGDMARYGLGYEQLKERFPKLVYVSVTGFGQTGPYAKRPGYDYLAQGMGGLMSVTGPAGGDPTRVGVAIADLMTGMHSTIAVLAALRYRDETGRGQHIDSALLDTQVSWLMNHALNYLVAGTIPERIGNNHPSVVPYRVFQTKDGYAILGAGNERQLHGFLDFAERPELKGHPSFLTNADRLNNREEVEGILAEIMLTKTTAEWVEGLEKAGTPCGPVNDISQVFSDPQIIARGMQQSIPGHAYAPEGVPTVAYPLKLSETPATYRRPPPILGQHTDEILQERLGLSAEEIDNLRKSGVI